MRTIFFILIEVLLYTSLSAQSYLPLIQNSDARNDYFLKGNPQSLYHQTFEISQDPQSGAITIGKEIDSYSEFSYRIYFTNGGDVQEFHHIYDGRPSTSLRYFFDPEGRYCVLQIAENSLTSYQRNWVSQYNDSPIQQNSVYNLIQEEYTMDYSSDSLLLTRRDTISFIEKDHILLSFFSSETATQYDSYPITDSAYYARYIDSCRNYVRPENRSINLYNEQEHLVKTIEYTSISEQPSYIVYFYYNEQGLPILEKRLNYTTFDEFGNTVYNPEPISDIFRYEYPDNAIDGQGNWTQRYVFRQFQTEKEQPLYLECQKISY